jgi:hypothetical protein
LLVFIDESGCPGFKLTQGSSSHFAIAMTIFTKHSEAEKASTAIQILRNKLRVKPEFKFSKSRNDIRDIFFKTINNFDFSVRALVVNKNYVYSHHLRNSKESFYNFFIRNLMQYDNKLLSNASVKIDGSGSKEFQNAMRAYLHKQLNIGSIKKLKFVNSKNDNLIQMADMIVGAIARSYNPEKKDHQRWKKMLETKIDNIWGFH